MHSLQLLGARANNLKSVDLTLHPGEVVVLTGVSGAGKSSLALDTLYAEGQRRFVESFSPYARQFLERLERPPMDRLEPVPAAVSVDRAAPVKSSRSTVATMTDIEPLLAGLFLRESTPTCPEHGLAATSLDATSAAQRLTSEYAGRRAILTYPIDIGASEQYLIVRDRLTEQGYRRLWLDGVRDIDEVRPSDVTKRGGVEVVLDRVRVQTKDEQRLAQGFEQGWQLGGGLVHTHWVDQSEPLVLRQGLSCPQCARALEAPRQGLFSYDSPLGACPTCRGFGRTIGIDLDKVIPDPHKSLKQRAIRPWNGRSTTWERRELEKLCDRHGIPVAVPWRRLSEEHKRWVLEGDGDWDQGLFPGVLGWFRWLETRTYKMHVRVLLSRYRSYDPCPTCQGRRLNELALSYHLLGENIANWHELEVGDLLERLHTCQPRTLQGDLLKRQLRGRLEYLRDVGLDYLTLDRQARTLSGGEAQRVTLTAALGTSLHHALFVLDEPSVGLHACDVPRLTRAMRKLAERDNIVLVVEHDPAIIAAADRVIELGPGAGPNGGELRFDGSVQAVLKTRGPTRRALKPERTKPRTPRRWRRSIEIFGARANNLQNIDVQVPLDILCAVTGPSGSGKSTLVADVVYPALARALGVSGIERPLAHDRIEGAQQIERVSLVDQSPLGRTSRGNAATYTKAWDPIRKLFADQPAARSAGLTASHFSFNVDRGRCTACAGEGYETVEMQFLADVQLICPVCRGRRFQEEVLRITYRGASVADVLSSTVDEVLSLFRSSPAVTRSLGPLTRLGLGYLKLGQPLSTLSGGEAQRLKLARALSEKLDGTLLIVDEPSAGLHADEVSVVLDCLHTIVDAGASVIVVEHDLQIIRNADWVIDLGPGSGYRGGRVTGAATPEVLMQQDSLTAGALREPPFAIKKRRAPRVSTAGLLIENAREHNLREVSVEIPHGALTVVTGPSGSGKSSLVFDVLFAEGQRRFLETLTPYARRFLPRMPKPNVDEVSGVPPSIALEQRTSRAGVNSTVATVTEIAHYLRLLYAKLGTPHCPEHGEPIGSVSTTSILNAIKKLKGRHRLLAPVVEARKGTYLDVFNSADRDGIELAICDGKLVDTSRPPQLNRAKEHSIDLMIAEVADPKKIRVEDFQRALSWGRGSVKLLPAVKRAPGAESSVSVGGVRRFSTHSACPICGLSVPELDPRWFSFNTVQGRCETCQGSGRIESTQGRRSQVVESRLCPDCNGARLHPLPRAVLVAGARYHEVSRLSVAEFRKTLQGYRFSGQQKKLAEPIGKELARRVDFLLQVGLGYLSLDRPARSLSGGEMQRLRLAAQLGAGLTGALYVLDEPTIGLHQRDTRRLVENLKSLVELGSTVVVVEHDQEVISAADHLIDMGPGGGTRGGRVMSRGAPHHVLQDPDSPTGRCFAEAPALRQPLKTPADPARLSVRGVHANNLKDIDVDFAVGRLNVVAGVSGSGKSTLVSGVVLRAVRKQLGLVTDPPGSYRELGPLCGIQRAVSVDQSPIGRTPRSVPATFLGIWDDIRKLYAQCPEAKVAGYTATRFSFNSAQGGRCSTCDGQGAITHEMSFLPDTVQTCPACDGLRFEPETLRVRRQGLNIGEVLKLSVEEALSVFENHPKVLAPLTTLAELGAGYLHLGQGSHTLSGGEAQRLKLSSELTATTRHEPTLYVLDEPTTGLHQGDVAKLMFVLGKLVDRGDTLIVIEHHPQVIAGADHVIELGPDGGARGGRVLASCTPLELQRKKTPTAAVVQGVLQPMASPTQPPPSRPRSKRRSSSQKRAPSAPTLDR